MDYRIEDTFDVSTRRYWQVFFDEDYNAALWPALDIDRELIRLERQGEGEDLVIVREQVLTPRRELPRFMEKLVRGALRYREKNRFTAKTDSMTVETIPSVLADKITARGVYRLEPIEAGRIRRIWEAQCVCSVPLVGKRIEEQIVNEVRDTYRKTTDITRRWLREHPDPG